MKKIVLILLLGVFGFVAPVNARTTQDVLSDVRIEGVGLSSTLDEVHKVIDRLKVEEWNCTENKAEERERPKFDKIRVYARRYHWSCLYQKPEAPSDWQRLTVNYLHDRVLGVVYEGSKEPDFGGLNQKEFLQDMDKDLQKASDLPENYEYNDYAEVHGASSQAFMQNIALKLKQSCNTIVGNAPSPYYLEFKSHQMYIPSQNAQTSSISIERSAMSFCLSLVAEKTNVRP